MFKAASYDRPFLVITVNELFIWVSFFIDLFEKFIHQSYLKNERGAVFLSAVQRAQLSCVRC